MTGQLAILVINPASSECDACGKGADLRETTHKTYIDYGVRGEGCGRRFVGTSTDWGDGKMMREAATKLRPDLPWVGPRYVLAPPPRREPTFTYTAKEDLGGR